MAVRSSVSPTDTTFSYILLFLTKKRLLVEAALLVALRSLVRSDSNRMLAVMLWSKRP